MLCLISFFFFKQMTAYDMLISDWIADGCSSDLPLHRYILARQPDASRLCRYRDRAAGAILERPRRHAARPLICERQLWFAPSPWRSPRSGCADRSPPTLRSEVRREGKECVSKCRSRWYTEHEKKT